MRRLLYSLLLFFAAHFAIGQTTQLETTKIIEDLDFPWEILWGPDHTIWMTETTGSVIRYNPVTDEENILIKLPVAVDPDHANPAAIGLFGLAIHPDFPSEPYVYVMYNYDLQEDDSLSTRIARLTYNEATDVLENEMIFVDGFKGYTKHSGGRMLITQDRKLLVTTGDEFVRSYAQRLDRLNGKTLRFNLDGSVPDDNPFAADLSEPYSYIYSIGHRNPQGLIQTPLGTIFSSEHGANSDDEVNIIELGNNYGWPYVKGDCDNNYPEGWNDNIAEGGESELAPYFGTDNHRADLYPQEYIDEDGFCNNLSISEPAYTSLDLRMAPSGLNYYNSDTIPEWKNALLLATLREKDIRLMKLNEAQDEIVSVEVIFDDSFDRVRDLAVTPYGDIYVISSEREDNNINSMYRIHKEFLEFSTPEKIELSYIDENIQLEWTANVDYLTYFIISRTHGGDKMVLDTLNFEERTFIDTNFLFGEEYTYDIQTMRAGEELEVSDSFVFEEDDYPFQFIFPQMLTLEWDDSEQGILIGWESEVDELSSFVIQRSDANSSLDLDTLLGNNTQYIDVSVDFGEPYGYVIKTLNNNEIIDKSDSVLFLESDYPELVTLAIEEQGFTIDLFNGEGSEIVREMTMALYDMSGQLIHQAHYYSWQDWVDLRSSITQQNKVLLWHARILQLDGEFTLLKGKYIY